ncbi:MAG: endonuclease III [Candidatus Burarchaeum sp.]|nr:endonuclease III [Candidatus Burarchaeum sp.]MDO8340082.1 endonuclease III [Candidatus Burarchaeum sp.]
MVRDNRKNASKIISLLKKEYPRAGVALRHDDPLQLLVATILSAQCTDTRVNAVTPALFARYRNVKAYANADIWELEKYVHSTGFYKNKAKNIKASSALTVSKFGGKVPDTMEELLELPGVARKTANVVLGGAFGKVEGIVVDTHVMRLSRLLGLTQNKEPAKIEQDLMKVVPRGAWWSFPNTLIWHGRRVCIARRPKCDVCVLNKLCPSSLV